MPGPSRFVTLWSALEAQVAAGTLPGYAAAVRYRGEVEVHTGGCLDLAGTRPVEPDSLTRSTGRPLRELLHDRVTGPLGLTDTGFWATDPTRLGPAYQPAGGGFEVIDPADGRSSRPPVFEGLAAGLVSSAPDVLAFLAALADGGGAVLGPGAVAELTSDQLTAVQRAAAGDVLGPGRSWGMQVAVQVEPAEPWAQPGRWGWDGGTGVTGHVGPGRGLVSVLLTARGVLPEPEFLGGFWPALHRCL